MRKEQLTLTHDTHIAKIAIVEVRELAVVEPSWPIRPIILAVITHVELCPLISIVSHDNFLQEPYGLVKTLGRDLVELNDPLALK